MNTFKILSPFLLLFVVSAWPAEILDDSHWYPQFCPPGVNGPVYAIASEGGNIYVGGEFTMAGGVPAHNVAVFDGVNWRALTSGIDGPVLAIGSIEGRVYFGGNFSRAGGVNAQNIAQWDPQNGWSALAEGTDGPVEAVRVLPGVILVGGKFAKAGSIAARNLARWSGDQWSIIGEPGNDGVDGEIAAIAANTSDHIYVGGRFTHAGAAAVMSIAEWRDSAWHDISGGIISSNSTSVTAGKVNSLDLTQDNTVLFVGGRFNIAGNIAAQNIASWDGSAWSTYGDGFSGGGGTVFAVHSDGMALFAGGNFTSSGDLEFPGAAIWRWDSPAWTPAVTDTDGPADVRVIARAPQGTVFGGNFLRAGGVEVNNIAAWDTVRFVGMGQGIHGAVYTAFTFGNNLVIGGLFDRAAGVLANNIAYLGLGYGSWNPLGTGVNDLVRAAVRNQFSYFAAGNFREAGGNPAPGFAQFNDIEWSSDNGGPDGAFSIIHAIGSLGDDRRCYIGGEFQSVNGVAARNMAYLENGVWTSLGTGLDGPVYAILVSGDDIIVGGSFSRAGGQPANCVAKWNSQSKTWSGYGNGISYLVPRNNAPSVQALALSGNILYVGGDFTQAGSVPASSVARWDGTEWHPLGQGVSGMVQALAAHGSELYVGGVFASAGGASANNAARWNGQEWSALGSGVDRPVLSMALWFNTLFLGGSFQTAGGQPASGMAQWVISDEPTVTITSPSNGATFEVGQDIPLKAAVSGFPTPPVRVDYYVPPLQNTIPGPAPDYTAALTGFPAGTYNVFASAYDAAGNSISASSVSITINPPSGNEPPKVVVTSPVNGDKFATGEAVILSADATDVDGTITRVEFFNGPALNAPLGSVDKPPFTTQFAFGDAGNMEIVARAVDNKGAATVSSNKVIISILGSNFPPDLFIEDPFDGAVLSAAKPISISATASDRGRVVRVEFFANDIPLAAIQGNQNNSYSFNWTDPAPGLYLIKAKATDDDGASTIKTARIQVVPQAQPAASKIIPASTSRPGFPAGGPIRSMVEHAGILYLAGDLAPQGLAALNAATGASTAWKPALDGPVNVLALYGERILIGGKFNVVDGQTRQNLASLDLNGKATPWQANVAGEVTAMAVGNSALYVAGNVSDGQGGTKFFTTAFALNSGALLPWDAQPNGKVYAIRPAGDRVYLGGEFTALHNLPRANLGAVDAENGLPLNWDANVGAPVYTIESHAGILYLGGAFQTVGGKPRKSLAAIDAATGRPIGWTADADGPVKFSTYGDGVLYLGGDFNSIDGVARIHLAALDVRLKSPNVLDWNPDLRLEGVPETIQSLLFTKSAVCVAGKIVTLAGTSYPLAAYDLPLRFEPAQRSVNGQITWTINGPLGKPFDLQTSQDLQHWNTLMTQSPPFDFQPERSDKTAFYRLTAQQ